MAGPFDTNLSRGRLFARGLLLGCGLLLLSGLARGQDLLVIAPIEFQPALREWKAHRTAQGHTVLVQEPRQDLKAQVKAVHAASGGKLSHVLLLGDVKQIPCGYFEGRIIRPYERDPRIANDLHLADLDGDHLPELAVGRLPADNIAEARLLLGKVVAYEKNRDLGRWQRRLNVIAGLGGFGKIQDWALERVATRFLTDNVPAACDVHATYANASSPFCPPPGKLQQTVLERFNEGALVVAYIGHGSRMRLDRMVYEGRRYDIFTDDDAFRLAARKGPPIAFLVCCNAGQFDAGPDCLGELMLKQAAGPVAVLAASRVSMPYGNAVLAKEVLEALYERRLPTLGEVLRQARRMAYPDRPQDKSRQFMESLAVAYQWRPDLRAQERLEHLYLYNLLGDPAMRIPLPALLDVECVLERTDGKLSVRVDLVLPTAGDLLVEIVARRDMPRPPRSGGSEAEFARAYELANRSAVAQLERRVDAAGPLEVRVELPRRLPFGFYHARAFFHAAQATGMGSADFRVRLDDDK